LSPIHWSQAGTKKTQRMADSPAPLRTLINPYRTALQLTPSSIITDKGLFDIPIINQLSGGIPPQQWKTTKSAVRYLHTIRPNPFCQPSIGRSPFFAVREVLRSICTIFVTICVTGPHVDITTYCTSVQNLYRTPLGDRKTRSRSISHTAVQAPARASPSKQWCSP